MTLLGTLAFHQLELRTNQALHHLVAAAFKVVIAMVVLAVQKMVIHLGIVTRIEIGMMKISLSKALLSNHVEILKAVRGTPQERVLLVMAGFLLSLLPFCCLKLCIRMDYSFKLQ